MEKFNPDDYDYDQAITTTEVTDGKEYTITRIPFKEEQYKKHLEEGMKLLAEMTLNRLNRITKKGVLEDGTG